ncbi:unnamed protein product, partial [Effrenium voratum]
RHRLLERRGCAAEPLLRPDLGGQDPRGGLRVRLLAGGGPGGAHDPHRSHRRSRPDR